MRVVFDGCCWANGRGYGRFTRELVGAMVAAAPDVEWVAVADDAAADCMELAAPNLRVQRVPLSRAGASATEQSRGLGDMLRLTRAVHALRPAVFFSPSVYTYFPLPPGTRSVVVVMDAIVERFPALTIPSRRARLLWNAKVWLALRQSTLVGTLSDFSARDIERVLGVRPSRLRVLPPGASPAFRPAGAGQVAAAAAAAGLPAGARWFMYVGGFNPHKRVDAVIRAHAAVAADAGAAGTAGAAPHLLLVGTLGDLFHDEVDALRALVRECGTEHLVHWTGFVADELLSHLHTGAVALVLPSEAEGLGLPAVEAAACGTPVIATTESPLPALLAGGGTFVAPGDAVAVAAAMRRYLGDEPARRAVGDVARERASTLTWAACADRAIAALREAAA